MAEKSEVNIGENTPEQVAYKLMQDIMRAEGIVAHTNPSGSQRTATRMWLLSTYAYCRSVVAGTRPQNDWPIDGSDWLRPNR